MKCPVKIIRNVCVGKTSRCLEKGVYEHSYISKSMEEV